MIATNSSFNGNSSNGNASNGNHNAGSDNGSSSGTGMQNVGAFSSTPEPKSASIPSGSRPEIHYPGVQTPSRIYDSKKNRKIVRIMTVMAYMFAVSLAAIVLSLYYVFLWDPNMQIQNNNNSGNASSNTTIIPDASKSDRLKQEEYQKIDSQQQLAQLSSASFSKNITKSKPSLASASTSPLTDVNVSKINFAANTLHSSLVSTVYRESGNETTESVSHMKKANVSTITLETNAESIVPDRIPSIVPDTNIDNEQYLHEIEINANKAVTNESKKPSKKR